jgi:hypothetical protein
VNILSGKVMFLKKYLFLLLIILGISLLLYGSNVYNGFFGWAGVLLIISGLSIRIILEFIHFNKKT